MDFWKKENEGHSLIFEILVLCFLSVIGMLMASLSIHGLAPYFGIPDFEAALVELTPETDQGTLNKVRILHIFAHLFMFMVPAIFFAQILYKGKAWSYLRMNQFPAAKFILPGILICILAFPFMHLVYWLNQLIPLPAYFKDMEDQAMGLTDAMLTMPDLKAFLLNLLVVAAIPALGEELIFRGVLQRLFIRASKRPHLGIWAAAFAFSAIHMQFEGFFPRLFLGALLGYLVYFSGSLWLAIIAHFVNNAMQIVVQFLYDRGQIPIDLENISRFPIWLSMISLILSAALVYYLYNSSTKEQKAYEMAIEDNFKEPENLEV